MGHQRSCSTTSAHDAALFSQLRVSERAVSPLLFDFTRHDLALGVEAQHDDRDLPAGGAGQLGRDLPAWQQPERAEPSLVAAWMRYFDALETHKRGMATRGRRQADPGHRRQANTT
jgi:hypothetical protein